MSIAQKLQTISENEQKVYNAGYKKGKQSEYDKFWDNYQQNGNRTVYRHAFSGVGWNSENFKPKYKVVLGGTRYQNSNSAFQHFDWLKKYPPLEINEGDIDFTNAAMMQYMFGNANISKVEMNAIPIPIDNTLASMSDLFSSADMGGTEVIKTIKLGVSEVTSFNVNSFKAKSITNVSFVEGSLIGKNIDFSSCLNLTNESLMNIINTLKDFSETTTTVTITLHANSKAKLTETDIATITQKGWTLA